MNIKTISLLISLVSLSTLHANTTKPSSETLYEKAANSAQKLTTGLRNLNPINAGCALLMALAANQTANNSLNQLVPTRQEAQQELDKAKAEVTVIGEELLKTYLRTRILQLKEFSIEAAQGIALPEDSENRHRHEEGIKKAQENFEIQKAIYDEAYEKLKAAQQTLTKEEPKGIIAVPVLLLDVLSTKTASVAMWLNFYNMFQRHTGNQPLEVPLLNYFDFSACLASKTWSLSVNLTAALNYLFN